MEKQRLFENINKEKDFDNLLFRQIDRDLRVSYGGKIPLEFGSIGSIYSLAQNINERRKAPYSKREVFDRVQVVAIRFFGEAKREEITQMVKHFQDQLD